MEELSCGASFLVIRLTKDNRVVAELLYFFHAHDLVFILVRANKRKGNSYCQTNTYPHANIVNQ